LSLRAPSVHTNSHEIKQQTGQIQFGSCGYTSQLRNCEFAKLVVKLAQGIGHERTEKYTGLLAELGNQMMLEIADKSIGYLFHVPSSIT
jgi:hypothetical protein